MYEGYEEDLRLFEEKHSRYGYEKLGDELLLAEIEFNRTKDNMAKQEKYLKAKQTKYNQTQEDYAKKVKEYEKLAADADPKDKEYRENLAKYEKLKVEYPKAEKNHTNATEYLDSMKETQLVTLPADIDIANDELEDAKKARQRIDPEKNKKALIERDIGRKTNREKPHLEQAKTTKKEAWEGIVKKLQEDSEARGCKTRPTDTICQAWAKDLDTTDPNSAVSKAKATYEGAQQAFERKEEEIKQAERDLKISNDKIAKYQKIMNDEQVEVAKAQEKVDKLEEIKAHLPARIAQWEEIVKTTESQMKEKKRLHDETLAIKERGPPHGSVEPRQKADAARKAMKSAKEAEEKFERELNATKRSYERARKKYEYNQAKHDDLLMRFERLDAEAERYMHGYTWENQGKMHALVLGIVLVPQLILLFCYCCGIIPFQGLYIFEYFWQKKPCIKDFHKKRYKKIRKNKILKTLKKEENEKAKGLDRYKKEPNRAYDEETTDSDCTDLGYDYEWTEYMTDKDDGDELCDYTRAQVRDNAKETPHWDMDPWDYPLLFDIDAKKRTYKVAWSGVVDKTITDQYGPMPEGRVERKMRKAGKKIAPLPGPARHEMKKIVRWAQTNEAMEWSDEEEGTHNPEDQTATDMEDSDDGPCSRYNMYTRDMTRRGVMKVRLFGGKTKAQGGKDKEKGKEAPPIKQFWDKRDDELENQLKKIRVHDRCRRLRNLRRKYKKLARMRKKWLDVEAKNEVAIRNGDEAAVTRLRRMALIYTERLRLLKEAIRRRKELNVRMKRREKRRIKNALKDEKKRRKWLKWKKAVKAGQRKDEKKWQGKGPRRARIRLVDTKMAMEMRADMERDEIEEDKMERRLNDDGKKRIAHAKKAKRDYLCYRQKRHWKKLAKPRLKKRKIERAESRRWMSEKQKKVFKKRPCCNPNRPWDLKKHGRHHRKHKDPAKEATRMAKYAKKCGERHRKHCKLHQKNHKKRPKDAKKKEEENEGKDGKKSRKKHAKDHKKQPKHAVKNTEYYAYRRYRRQLKKQAKKRREVEMVEFLAEITEMYIDQLSGKEFKRLAAELIRRLRKEVRKHPRRWRTTFFRKARKGPSKDRKKSKKHGKKLSKDGKKHSKDGKKHSKDRKKRSKNRKKHSKEGKKDEKDLNDDEKNKRKLAKVHKKRSKNRKKHSKDRKKRSKDGKKQSKEGKKHSKNRKKHWKNGKKHSKDGKKHSKDGKKRTKSKDHKKGSKDGKGKDGKHHKRKHKRHHRKDHKRRPKIPLQSGGFVARIPDALPRPPREDPTQPDPADTEVAPIFVMDERVHPHEDKTQVARTVVVDEGPPIDAERTQDTVLSLLRRNTAGIDTLKMHQVDNSEEDKTQATGTTDKADGGTSVTGPGTTATQQAKSTTGTGQAKSTTPPTTGTAFRV